MISTRSTITALFYVLFGVFIAWYVFRLNWGVLEGPSISWQPLALATLFALAFRYCGIVAWLQILKGLGAETIGNRVELSHIYAKSWLGRYVPGKVSWILGKVHFASTLGIPKRDLAVGSVFEGALQVTVVLFLSSSLLALDPRLDVFAPRQKALLIVGSIALLALMSPAIFNRLVRFLHQRWRSSAYTPAAGITHGTLARAFGLTGVGFALSGVAYFFFTRAIHPDLSYDHIFFVAGAFNLAGAIGIISVFAPSGLGVREGVQLLLLPLIMPAEVALAVTVAARVWSLSVDFLFFGVTWLHRRLTSVARASFRIERHEVQ